jgi:hypothetical protein
MIKECSEPVTEKKWMDDENVEKAKKEATPDEA